MSMRPLISPNTGTAIGEWRPDGPVEAEHALARLDAALPAIDPPEARKAALDRLGAAIEAHRAEIESVVVREVAKTPAEAAAYSTTAGEAAASAFHASAAVVAAAAASEAAQVTPAITVTDMEEQVRQEQ